MRTLLITLLLNLCYLTNTFAQIEKDTIVAYQYYQKADSLLTLKNYNESIVLFKKAAPIYKQAKVWDRLAKCYIKIADNYQLAKDIKQSVAYSDKALAICDQYLPKNHIQKANYYDQMGKKAELFDLKYDKALEYYKKGLEIKQRSLKEESIPIAFSHGNIGRVYWKRGDFQKSLEHLLKDYHIKSNIYGKHHPKIASVIFNLADTYRDLDQLDQSIKIAKDGLKVAEEEFEKNYTIIGQYHFEIGNSYKRKNDTKNALFHHEKALKIFQKNSKNGISAPSFIFSSIGGVYLDSGKYEKAIEYYKMALSDKATKKDKTNYFVNYHNIASAYKELGELDLALKYMIPVVEKGQKVFGKYYFRLADGYLTLGDIYRRKHDFSKAFEYLDLSLKILQKKFGENHNRVFYANEFLGDLYNDQGKYDKALEHYQAAFRVSQNVNNQLFVSLAYYKMAKIHFSKRNYKQAIHTLTDAESHVFLKDYHRKNVAKSNLYDCFSPNLLLDIYISQAKILKTLYIQQKQKNASKVLKKINQIDDLITKMSTNYASITDKINFSKQVVAAYREAIDFQIYLYTQQSKIEYLKNAYRFVEKSKSITLKSILNNDDAKSFIGSEKHVLELDRTLKTDKAYYISKNIKERSAKILDTIAILTIETKLFEINRKQDSLNQILEKNYPNYVQLKKEDKVVPIEDVQKKLDPKTTLLEFFVSDSTTYAFIISKETFDVKKLNTSSLLEQITILRKAIVDKNVRTYKKNALELYTTLISPIKDQIIGNQLIIVPDGPLWHLNFDLLLTKDSPSKNPTDLPYLLHEYAISYANSATLLFDPFKNENQKITQEGCLAFSFSDSTHSVTAEQMSLATLRNTDEDLPGTRKEIKAISEIIDGQYFFGANASESTFKKNARDYKIIHLALHGEVDNERPENSKLYFTKGKDTIEDNYLYSHELFALHIPAELTVLSACKTGTGKIAKGEGIMSLGNAFQYAGTKSLLLSSWDVSDATTPLLMKNFYSNLKEGMNKSRALQQAKIQYLTQADAYKTAPFYWGGFYLVGNTAPIHFENPTKWYWILGITTIIIMLLIIWGLYQRKNNNTSKSL